MVIETKRLILRQPVVSDVKEALQIHNQEFVLQYNCMHKFSKPEMLEEIKKSKDNTLFIELKESHQLIGAITLEEDNLRYCVAAINLTYYLAKDYTKKGYMKEALQAVIQHLFEEQKNVISARAFTKNIASNALLKSLGFHHEGTLKYAVKGYNDIVYDDELYALYRSDWGK